MIVLVTGGAGFIGSHVVDRLRANGHEPRIFDIVRSPYVDGDVESVLGDLLDQEALSRAMRGCDAVVHLAAVADVSAVVADPARADLVNVQGTQRALEAARSSDVGRFVYASTVWVYDGISTNGHLLDEDTPMRLPNHFYTATKLAGEMYCRAYSELFDLKQTTLRFGIPYGPRSRASAVVAAFVARAREGKPLEIRGDGRQSRQFVYVEDLADGVVAALESPASGVFNLVGEESVTVEAIARRVCEVVAKVPIVYVESRKADVQAGRASAERATRELGWRADTTFDVGFRRYVDWVNGTNGSSRAAAESTIAGNAATVLRQEPREL
jgi:UDP-glucose 4-epimerase